MKPFKLSDTALKITGAYPTPDMVEALIHGYNHEEHDSFVKLWLSEGIPSAFDNCPFIYQACREWLGRRIEAEPQNIGLVGSARLGYSLKPAAFRRPFCEKSDLDFLVISEQLFHVLATESKRFIREFEDGKAKPRTNAEKRLWPRDVEFIHRNIPRGFVHQGKVPTFSSYPSIQKIENDFWVLSEKLKLTPAVRPFTKATFRVYKSHSAFVAQASLNLRTALLRVS